MNFPEASALEFNEQEKEPRALALPNRSKLPHALRKLASEAARRAAATRSSSYTNASTHEAQRAQPCSERGQNRRPKKIEWSLYSV